MSGMDKQLNNKASDNTPSFMHGFSEQEIEEAEATELFLKRTTHTNTSPASPSIYSLTSGASPIQRVPTRRSPHHHPPSPSAPSSASNSSTLDTIHPSDHMKTLLLQLQSTISSSNAAFTLCQASSTPSHASAEADFSRARHAIAEELHTLSSLHMQLYSLTQEHDLFGDTHEQDSSRETVESTTGAINIHVQRQEAMLKSYEGVISRFHDDIRRKDVVTEALKETLARSMLRGEKLERQIKALQAQFSSSQIN